MALMQDDITKLLKQVGNAWGWLLALGVVTIAAGLSMFFFTSQALYFIAVTFGIYLILSGVFHFVSAFSTPHEEGWLRALYAVLSAMSVVVGVYLVDHKILSLIVLTLLVGFFWIFTGMLQMAIGIEFRALPYHGWTIAIGFLDVLAGFIIVFYPAMSTLVLAMLLGFWLVVRGTIMVANAFTVRDVTSHLAA